MEPFRLFDKPWKVLTGGSQLFSMFCTTIIKVIRKYALLAGFILLNSFGLLKGQLSPDARISILTCSPGNELYSIFGHTAIRVSDTRLGMDYVFNYGTFNFNTPHFYLKFMRGQLNYMLSVSTFSQFMVEYRYNQRSVWEQELNLDDSEKQALFNALVINAEPQNRFYHYHFFFDNCATRVRDMAINHLSHPVVFSSVPNDTIPSMSFRQAIATYLEQRPWTRLGLDLILGSPTDDPVNAQTIQFLPNYLMLQFEGSRRNNSGHKLVHPTKTLLTFNHLPEKTTAQPGYVLTLAALVLGLLTWLQLRKGFNLKWIDRFLFLLVGVIGLLITFLWFFTQHTVTGPNWHLLWANPLYLLLAFGPSIYRGFFRYLSLMLGIGVVFVLLFFWALPQYMPPVLIPVWLVLVLRLGIAYRR